MKIQDLNLNNNPFEYLTPIPDGVDFWAGLSDIKKRIEDIYRNAFANDSRNLILNYGTFGGGKTYAAYYFKKRTFKKYEKTQLINIYALPPGDGNKITQQLFYDIIDGISFDVLRSMINKSSIELGEKELFKLIFSKINSEEYAKAIINLGKEGNILNSQIVALTQRYLFGNITSKELNTLGLNRKLSSDADYRKFLSGLLLAITATKTPVRVFFWLDELESLVYYTSKQYREFSQIIRYLVDTVGEKFTVFMNFTFSESEEENVRMLIGEALWSRINQKIYFKPLSVKDALIYCKDLLKNSQIDKTKGDFNPFEENAIKEILGNLNQTDLIPREINRNLNELIQFALKEKQEIIDVNLYKKWFNSKAVF